MTQTVRGQDGGDRSLTPVCACLAACNTENSRPPLHLQAARLMRAHGFTPEVAFTIAELAFTPTARRS